MNLWANKIWGKNIFWSGQTFNLRKIFCRQKILDKKIGPKKHFGQKKFKISGPKISWAKKVFEVKQAVAQLCQAQHCLS